MSATATAERPNIEAILNGHIESAALGRKYRVTRNQTDAGNAERFVDHFADVVRYDHAAGKWLYWDNRRWALDATGKIMHLARIVVRGIYAEAQRAEDSTQRKALSDWAQRSENAGRIRAMVELAKADPTIATDTTAFDADPDILNVRNGIVDLRSGELLEHDPSRMCSKLAPFDYRPELLERDAEGMPGYVTAGPTFAGFVAEIMLGRRDAVEWLQRLKGYGATGHASEQLLALFVGRGRNGKGTLLRAVQRVLGDYMQTAPPELLVDTNRRGAGPSPELARLHGVRLLEVEETSDGDRLHESKVKWLTGEDRLVARPLYGDYFEFEPQFTPVLVTNHKPRVTTGGLSMWRRLQVLPFDFIAEKADKALTSKLEDESEAILAWVVEGAMGWYSAGMPTSQTVEAASSKYRDEQDSIGPFLRDATLDVGQIRKATLYKAYLRWAEGEGERPMSTRAFHSAMREAGFEEVGDRKYPDLSLKPEFENP